MPAVIAGHFFDELLRQRHDDGGRLLLGASETRRCLFHGGATPQHADGRRQGDDGPQRAASACSTRRETGYDETKRLIGNGMARAATTYAITPALRHHLDAGADGGGASAGRASFRDCYVQTHLSENQRRDRLYLLALSGCRGLYRHLCPLRPARPTRRCSATASISATGRCGAWRRPAAVGVFCPTSNLFLGSGLFDRDRFDRLRRPSGRSRPISAAAPAIRCWRRWTRPTRS